MPDPRCPVCGRPSRPRGQGAPFCSDRCRQVDLARWFTGAYAVPAEEAEPDEDDTPAGQG